MLWQDAPGLQVWSSSTGQSVALEQAGYTQTALSIALANCVLSGRHATPGSQLLEPSFGVQRLTQ